LSSHHFVSMLIEVPAHYCGKWTRLQILFTGGWSLATLAAPLRFASARAGEKVECPPAHRAPASPHISVTLVANFFSPREEKIRYRAHRRERGFRPGGQGLKITVPCLVAHGFCQRLFSVPSVACAVESLLDSGRRRCCLSHSRPCLAEVRPAPAWLPIRQLTDRCRQALKPGREFCCPACLRPHGFARAPGVIEGQAGFNYAVRNGERGFRPRGFFTRSWTTMREQSRQIMCWPLGERAKRVDPQ
jgi:hypothetical protein